MNNLNLDAVKTECPLCVYEMRALKGVRVNIYRSKMDKASFYRFLYEIVLKENTLLARQGKRTFDVSLEYIKIHMDEHVVNPCLSVLDDIAVTQRLQRLLADKVESNNKVDVPAARMWESLSKHKMALLNRLEAQPESAPLANRAYSFD